MVKEKTMKKTKVKVLCAITSAALVFGGVAITPVNVFADDIDDFLDDLIDMSDDEIDILDLIDDYDDDDDIDEDDVEAIETAILAARRQEEARKAEQEAQQRRIAQQQEQINAQQAQINKLKEANKYVNVTGVAVSSTDVTLTPGQTYQIIGYVKPDNANNRGVSYYTSDATVATVDGSGIIKANNPGSCIITTSTNEHGYTARTTVRVNPHATVVAQTQLADAQWMQAATAMILQAAPGATVNLFAAKPMGFDINVVNALKMRPDVSLLVAYLYNGHSYLMSVPAGYNLTSRVDKTGKVGFLSLAASKDGKIKVVMTQ